METNKILNILLGNKYYSIEDLRFNTNVGLLLNSEEINTILKAKDDLIDENNKYFISLPLKTFNSKHIFFTNGKYIQNLIMDIASIYNNDISENGSFIIERNMDDLLLSRLFSEIEGTLRLENVPITHKRIQQIYNNENVLDTNDIIIKNMFDAISFIDHEKPEFNKENLFKLYNILSHDCLAQDEILSDGQYYRNDSVYIGKYKGAPCEKINEMMDSLFDFVKNSSKDDMFYNLIPHICHYYILYVHPYFDYNGRTARMVSYWISQIFNIQMSPTFISEAINENKNLYYKALVNTRNTNNDLTYFIGYILETSINFSLIYKNIEYINKLKSVSGNFLSKSQLMHIKKILLHNSNDYFNYKMFNGYINNNYTKQRSLTILNELTEEDILEKAINRKGEAVFKFNQEMIKYKIK